MTLAEMELGAQVWVTCQRPGEDQYHGEKFTVVQQGKPSESYDDSFVGGTILMHYDSRAFLQAGMLENEKGTKCDYNETRAHLQYLTADGLFEETLGLDPEVAAHVMTVKIPYRAGRSGNTVDWTLEAKYWIPSAMEVALFADENEDEAEDGDIYVQEGYRFAYFRGLYSSGYQQWLAKNGYEQLDRWFTRTPARLSADLRFYAVNQYGRAYPYSTDENLAARVCMVMPGNTRVDDDGYMRFGSALPVKTGGVWKSGAASCKVGGVWKQTGQTAVKAAGVWKT